MIISKNKQIDKSYFRKPNTGKRWIILYTALFMLLMLSTNLSYSQSSSAFEQANKHYIEKNYDKAIAKYEEMIKSGNVSAEIFFNIGNAYYKKENYPAAILNYERARKLSPSDDDIDFNLRLANLNTIDKIEPAPQVFYVKWWNNFLNSSSIESHSKKAVLFIWIAFAFAILYVLINSSTVKRITFIAAFLMLFAGFFMLFLAYQQYAELNNNKSAIIFSSSSYIKSSPDDNSTNLFMLHGGTKVTVIDELTGWKRIRIANGNEGWIASSAIEII